MDKNIRLISLMAATAFLLPSCIFFGASTEKLYSRAYKKKPYDAIIVPGIPYDSTLGKWGDIMKARVYWSLYLYQNGLAKNIIYSGSAVYSPYVEAHIMAMYGIALGIPEENIFIESKAEHSTENLYYSYYLGKKNGFKKIAFASDPFQTRFMRRFPKKMNIQVDFIPIVFDTLNAMTLTDFPIDAEKARATNYISIIERESKWKRFKGTLGKNIQWVEEDVFYSKNKK